jgi:alpha-tubulin suppressor-like RCC1 family protein
VGKVAKWKTPPSGGEPERVPTGATEAERELERELAEELAGAEALIRELEDELLRCEQVEARLCEQIDGGAGLGGLAGGNTIYISGDFTGTDKVVAVGSANSAMYALTAAGKVWTWGEGTESGYYNKPNPALPQIIQIREPVVMVSAPHHGEHMLALGRSGAVYGWGDAQSGQLFNWVQGGYASHIQLVPADVMPYVRHYLHTFETITHVYTGAYDTSYLLTSEHRVLFGGNPRLCSAGMSFPDGVEVSAPLDITPNIPLRNGEVIVQLIVGAYRAIALTDQHHAYSWGFNRFGQTGVAYESEAVCTPVEINGNFPLGAEEYFVDGDANGYATVLWTNQGNLFFMGQMEYDFEQDESYQLVVEPRLITTGVDFATSGIIFMMVVKDGGRSLWIVGISVVTENGVEYFTDITSTLHLADGETIVQTDFGNDEDPNGVILTSAGRVFTFGYGGTGLLGNGQELEFSLLPIEITPYLQGPGAYVSSVTFGDIPATSFELINDHLLAVVVPAGLRPGETEVHVNGSTTQTFPYEYVNELCARMPVGAAR